MGRLYTTRRGHGASLLPDRGGRPRGRPDPGVVRRLAPAFRADTGRRRPVPGPLTPEVHVTRRSRSLAALRRARPGAPRGGLRAGAPARAPTAAPAEGRGGAGPRLQDQRPRLRRLLLRRPEPPRRPRGPERLLDPAPLLHLRPHAVEVALAARAAGGEQQGRLQVDRRQHALRQGRCGSSGPSGPTRSPSAWRPRRTSTSWTRFQGYRSVEKNPFDLYRWDSSRDLGLAAAGRASARRAARATAFQFGNGSGTGSEIDAEQGGAGAAHPPLRERPRPRGLRRLAGPAGRAGRLDARGLRRLAGEDVARVAPVRPPGPRAGGPRRLGPLARLPLRLRGGAGLARG